ncbi:MAG TPA: hypothetical protein PLJ58_00830 [bacterium]|jgi:hypothetical protein|nr:hypothetical protein [bacterium]
MSKRPKLHLLLLWYSTLLSTLITVIGFFTSRTLNYFVANVLYLPVTIVLWSFVISRFRPKA